MATLVKLVQPPCPKGFTRQPWQQQQQQQQAKFCELQRFRLINPMKAAAQSSSPSSVKVSQIKENLYQALQGINRGIFGTTSGKKSEIQELVEQLESQNPTPDPTLNLHKVDGCWKLIYSTISIMGAKRTKLGLRDFITLGDLFQIINVAERVTITYRESTITPDQLMNVFQKNYDLLLSIFNPEGWLELTYVDDEMRIGRDQKGNIFVLERSEERIDL
ncbi:unnamed protein product [Linum tenue]|uniref:Plastid lipid-associated protein/fibrillin conserved domain-containing protein n=1 Tax=Linum tenue TaxID=586396 RepID=A0AAV0L3K7_9ROSI|nr:unnamed protein product [Linum tenue]